MCPHNCSRPSLNVDGEAGNPFPFSTADISKGQSPFPRNLPEQILFNNVLKAPELGKSVTDEIGDPRFSAAAGWVKLSQKTKDVNGRSIDVHYLYNTKSKIVLDVKVVTKQFYSNETKIPGK